MGNDVRRRTPMGKADAKASNHVLVGLGVGIITAVSGLSVAGTMTAINAMNRQSDEAIEAARISAANNAAQQQQQPTYPQGYILVPQDQQGQPGIPGDNGNGDDTGIVHTVESEATATPEPEVTPEPAKSEGSEKWTSDQIGWMQDNKVVYDEYGLPEDQSGNLLDDPTTHVYDPARRAYFFNDDGTPKTPYIDDLPTTADYNEAENPIVVPHVDVVGGDDQKPGDEKPVGTDPDKPEGDVVNPDGSVTHPDGSITNPDGSVTNPDGSVTNPDGTITNPDGSVTNPDGTITNPDGTITHPDGSVTNPDGSEVDPDGHSSEDNPEDTDPEGNDPEAVKPENPDDGSGRLPGRGERTRPASEWWYEDNGNLLPGVQLDGSGKPYYVVKSGDALSRLGRRFGYDWHELARVSGLVDDEGNYKGLHPGDIIRFPDHAPEQAPEKVPDSRAPGRG